ncbi:MAG: hypothetical protein B1H04_02680 [Planctomycetales bacterium 4484_123]|nr:MAG: hypothetical protein B1H04_02680 [Planctomycetales bacterium 4484_123]
MRVLLKIAVAAALASAPGCGQVDTETLYAPAELARIAGWHGADVNSPETFRFVVMSDRTGGHEPGAWARAVAEINRLRPDFVMCVGDLIEGYKKDPAIIRQQWREIDELTKRLHAPFFYCPGNHDIEYGPTRKMYTALHGTGGKTYYSFDYRGCHFVVLDTTAIVNDLREVADAQWAWLAKDLARARGARHVFIFYHHPLFGRPAWARIRKLLDPAKTTVFTGHRHRLSFDTEDGVPYYVLGPTAVKAPPLPRDKGRFQMFAHVTVSAGRPTVALIPLGQVLPHDFISRAVSKRLRQVAKSMTLSTVTRAAGRAVLELRNDTDAKVIYSLNWSGPAAWFATGLPQPESLTVGAGGVARRTYRIRPTKPALAPPALEVSYTLNYKGQTGQGKRRLTLPVAAQLAAVRVTGITIDGKLDDWDKVTPVAAEARWQVRDNPAAWTGPGDCTLKVRLGHDQANLYLAVDVTDETIFTEDKQSWFRDGIEIFWDPRPPANQDGTFAGPCRQLLIPLPAEGAAPELSTNPHDAALASAVRMVSRRRKGGYVVELAIPFAAIAEDFHPGPGKSLRLEVLANDRDGPDRKADLSCMVLSGDSDASRNTAGYAIVTFK